MEVAGPLGTPLGLAQWKRASPRGEAGTSVGPSKGKEAWPLPNSALQVLSQVYFGGWSFYFYEVQFTFVIVITRYVLSKEYLI